MNSTKNTTKCWLTWTYLAKITFTLVLWCYPLLFRGEDIRLQLNVEASVVDYVLFALGWAYLALCVGYSVGLWQLVKYQQKNIGPIWAGIVSNGGAAVFLTGFVLEYQTHIVQWLFCYVAISAAGAALVTISLFYFGLLKVERQK